MKRFISLLLIICLIFSLAGCTRNSEEEPTGAVEEAPEQEGTIKSIINLQMRDVDVLDPILTTRQSVRDGLLTVFEPLFNITDNFGLENVLAESYAFNDSATIMTLKLKENVLWHNGYPLNSEDVVYTVNKILAHPQGSYYANLETVDRVEKQNEYEVVFYLKEPNAQLIYSLYFPIQFRNETAYDTIIGTGPYMFEKTDGQSLKLIKNTSWHKGEVMADGVEFIYMRTAKMAEEAFASGKLHAVTKDMLDTENFAIKENQKKYVYPDGLFEFVGFNANAGIFSDPLLRVAASNAIDRSALKDVFDEAIVSGFPIMTGSEVFSPSYEASVYSLDYAKEIIFSAGYLDMDGDGKLEKIINEEEQELAFTLLVADRDPARGNAANIIKEQLLLAGFDVTVEIVDLETYNTRVSGGEYDAFLGAVYYDAPYDVSDLLASNGWVNYQGYKSDEMDKALSDFASGADMNKAPAAFSEIQALYLVHQPVAGLVFRTTYVLTHASIGGEVAPFPYSPYANIAKWSVE